MGLTFPRPSVIILSLLVPANWLYSVFFYCYDVVLLNQCDLDCFRTTIEPPAEEKAVSWIINQFSEVLALFYVGGVSL